MNYKLINNENEINNIFDNIKELVISSRNRVYTTVDYSKAKNLIQYYNDTNSIPKSIVSSSLYNLAAFSNYFNVIKIYEINIEFTINDYQQ